MEGEASTRVIRLRVKRDAYPWLNKAADEVNSVWNWANETSYNARRRTDKASKWMSGFDLNNLSAGASEYYEHIGADTIQRINCMYASQRYAAKKIKLCWRKSGGSCKSLGWVPFKARDIKRKGTCVRFCGKAIRTFQISRLDDVKWRDGQFAQDACGDWWLCLPVTVECADDLAPKKEVGIDLGLKTCATTSDGDKLESRFYRNMESKIAQAQRRGHKKQAKRLYRKVARQRADALHKFSRKVVNEYQNIFIGDVSSIKLSKTRFAKSVYDSAWGKLKAQLQYKGQWAGRRVEVVNEAYTTRACSTCGALTGPTGWTGLAVRAWTCRDCGAVHDRDINAAKNILARANALASVCGNELSCRNNHGMEHGCGLQRRPDSYRTNTV